MSDPSRPVLWLRAEDVALGPLRSDLAAEYWRWENDPQAVLGYGRQVPESLESRTGGLQHQLDGAPDQARFTVHGTTGDDPHPVGLTSLLIDHQRSALPSSSSSSPPKPGAGASAPPPPGSPSTTPSTSSDCAWSG